MDKRMKKHLFLEGPIQEGKSTLIRKLLREYMPQLGGFSSQRLLDDAGETVGFRITGPEEAQELTRKYSPELPDIFLWFQGRSAEKSPEVFTNSAVRYLRESKEKKLILLDEIGGVELQSPEFRQELYGILAGDIPCLGVLKLESSNRNMYDNAVIDGECVDYHLQLRDYLEGRFDAEILYFERKLSVQTENVLREFVSRILGADAN